LIELIINLIGSAVIEIW